MEALYFTAPWCQPCKVFGPVMDKIDGTVSVNKIDITENMDKVGQYSVQSVPTVVFVKEGDEYGRFSGAQTEPWVREFISQLGD